MMRVLYYIPLGGAFIALAQRVITGREVEIYKVEQWWYYQVFCMYAAVGYGIYVLAS